MLLQEKGELDRKREETEMEMKRSRRVGRREHERERRAERRGQANYMLPLSTQMPVSQPWKGAYWEGGRKGVQVIRRCVPVLSFSHVWDR